MKATFRKLLSAALLAVVGTALGLVATSGPAAAFATYSIRFEHSGKCLDLYRGQAVAGATIQQWDCARPNDANYWNQRWDFVFTYGEYALIRKTGTNLCATPENSDRNGAPILLQSCLGAVSNWRGILRHPSNTNQPPPHWYSLHSDYTGNCLDMRGNSTANGAVAQQWDCVAGNANQHLTW